MTDGITLIRRRAASMTNELKSNKGSTKSKQIVQEISEEKNVTIGAADITTKNGAERLEAALSEDEPFVVVGQVHIIHTYILV